MSHRLCTAVILCAISASLSGCLFLRPYPERWPPQASNIDPCAALRGRYSPTGEYGDPSLVRNYSPPLGPPLLVTYLGAYPAQAERQRRINKTEWVEISFGDDRTLRVRASQNGDVIAERTYSETDGTLSCNDRDAEVLAYGPSLPEGKGNPLAGLSWGATYLRRAEDGSLIIKRRESGFGLIFMLFPVAYIDTSWARFSAKN